VIALIDYGAGNLTSVRKAFRALGADLMTPQAPSELPGVRGIVVPGVGHFGATAAIDDNWRRAIREAVDRNAALLGICLGMQWLYERSAEAPTLAGLGLFEGCCERFAPDGAARKIPHVGWNSLDEPRGDGLMSSVAARSQVYFTHSYFAPVTPDAAATTTYGQTFAAVVERGRIAGVQFHPEKSGETGLHILRNWIRAL
jgi:imidazole glycerol-phosphate synthase subunit HisH